MAAEDKAKDGRTVTLKHVRLSFTDSLKVKKKTSDDPNAKEKHSMNVILEKGDPNFAENAAKVMSAIRAACEKEWKKPDAWKDIAEEAPKRICFRKGERFKNKEGKPYAGYEGNYGLTGSGPKGGQNRPKLYDRRKRAVEVDDIDTVFYGGCYGDVIVSFFGTEKGSRGVFCSFEAVRSLEEGEAMGGGIYVDADDFDDVEDDDSFDDGPKTGSTSDLVAADDDDLV